MNDTTVKPALYCGTYGKYNDGSISGKWLHLEDYADADEFFKACAELHKDEDDPEYMFQDFEGIPRELYGESLSTADVERIYTWLGYDEDEREIIADYWDNVSSDTDPDDALYHYEGNIDDMKGESFMNNDTAYGWYIIDNGLLGIEIPDALVNYLDVESIGRDYSQDLTITDDGNIFNHS